MAEVVLENLPNELLGQVALNLNLAGLSKFCQTSRRHLDFCRDETFIDAWLNLHHPELTNLFRDYVNFHPELSFIEVINNLIEHVKKAAELLSKKRKGFCPFLLAN